MKTLTAEKVLHKHLTRPLYSEAAWNCMLKAMKEYAKSKCKEQRIICQEVYDIPDAVIGNVFENAPEPKFD